MRPESQSVARREVTPHRGETQPWLRYCERVQDPITELVSATALYAKAAEVAARRRVERDAVIAGAFAAGVPIRVIATTVGLTGARVSSILGHPMGRPGRPTQSSSSASAPA